jgi:hypothetical protein
LGQVKWEMKLYLVKPSPQRLLGSITAVVLMSCVLAGVVLYSYEIITHSDPEPTPRGEYVRLFILDITFWGPMLLLATWLVSIPLILVLGVLAACARRGPAPTGTGDTRTTQCTR